MNQFITKAKNKDAVTVYYIGTFCHDFAMALTFGIYAIFLLRSGLDLLQINLVNAVYMISLFFLEVPTGAFADSLGRKKSVLISTVFLSVGLMLYGVVSGFKGFLLAEFLIAMASAFASGAFDAWMVDTAKSQGYEGKVDMIFSKNNIITRFALIFGGLIGAYLASSYIKLPFLTGGLMGVGVFFFLSFYMHDDKPGSRFSLKESLLSIKTTAIESIKYSATHKIIPWLIVGSSLATFVVQPLNMFWGPRFNEMAGDKIWITGWFWAAISISMIVGAYYVNHLIKNGKSYTKILVAVSFGYFIPILVSALSHNLFFAFPAFLLYELFRGMRGPVEQSYLNKYAEPAKRATIISFESMVGGLAAASGLVFFGWIGRNTSIEISWILTAVLSLGLIPVYLMARKKAKKGIITAATLRPSSV